jgi:hypothetical protein
MKPNDDPGSYLIFLELQNPGDAMPRKENAGTRSS